MSLSVSPAWPPASMCSHRPPKKTARVHECLHRLGGPDAIDQDAVQFRKLKRSDRKELQALNAEWFPVPYPELFYTEALETDALNSIAATLKYPCKKKGDPDELLLGVITFRTKFEYPRSDMLSVLPDGGRVCMTGAAAYVVTLGVVDACRRHGLASKLLQRAISEMKEKLPNLQAVWLHVVSYNAPALRLYQQAEFRIIRRFPNFYEFLGSAWDSQLLVCYFRDAGPPANLCIRVAYDEACTFPSRCMRAAGWIWRDLVFPSLKTTPHS